MKLSLISTVLNEEETVENLFNSITAQTKNPDEIIIVDGGSTDNTLSVISNFQFPISNKKIKVRTLVRRGNRSVGRNEAINNATGDIILCTDAGNTLDKDWVKNIIKPFEDPKVDVVAGYYKGEAKNIFQKCLIPYVLVMPDRANPNNFLPATRSMAFRKSVWEKNGGFDEKLSHNEDYAFARKLKENKFNIVFAKDAIVNWMPPKSIWKAFIMFFRFAYGDAEAGIYRPKALFVLARYLFGIILFIFFLFTNSLFLFVLLWVFLLNYITWSILKNYRYVRSSIVMIYLPLIQFISDIAVIFGTAIGFMTRFRK